MKTENLIINCNRISLDSSSQLTVDNYPNSGFYIITNSKIDSLYYVNKENNTVIYIDTLAQIKSLSSKGGVVEQIKNAKFIDSTVITGDVLLKTIAMLSNNEKFKDLK